MMLVAVVRERVSLNRLEGLEENLGMPLPAATQCQIIVETALPLQPAHEELMRSLASPPDSRLRVAETAASGLFASHSIVFPWVWRPTN